jgi:uncharacterized Zn-binding protein involved in type VI secretion
MAAICRQTDTTTGHPGSHGPRGFQGSAGSSNVFANGIKVIRADIIDLLLDAHTSTLNDEYVSSGSSTVFVNGKAVARKGDPVSCGGGSTMDTGSPDVFAG